MVADSRQLSASRSSLLPSHSFSGRVHRSWRLRRCSENRGPPEMIHRKRYSQLEGRTLRGIHWFSTTFLENSSNELGRWTHWTQCFDLTYCFKFMWWQWSGFPKQADTQKILFEFPAVRSWGEGAGAGSQSKRWFICLTLQSQGKQFG